jgi:hypothetical protein
MITVDKQVELFFEAVKLAGQGKRKQAHDIFTTLRTAYPNSVQLLIWYAKTCDNQQVAVTCCSRHTTATRRTLKSSGLMLNYLTSCGSGRWGRVKM